MGCVILPRDYLDNFRKIRIFKFDFSNIPIF